MALQQKLLYQRNDPEPVLLGVVKSLEYKVFVVRLYHERKFYMCISAQLDKDIVT